jgi:hypothetical protein
MGFIICTGFAPEVKENPYKELYKRDYIKRSIANLIKLVEEKKDGIKCGLRLVETASGEYDAELIEIVCVDHTVFPTSEVAIPIVWTEELRESCKCNTVKYAKEYLESRESSLADLVFEWIRCEDCKAKTLWRIIETIGLNKIVKYEQVTELFRIDLTELK